MNRIRYQVNLFALLALAISFSLIPAAWAAENESTEEEIVVTATRTEKAQSEAPGLTEVIEGDDVQDPETSTVAEVLTDNGQLVSTYGGASGVANIRLGGSSAAQTLVLVNGVPLNTGAVGSVDLSYYPSAGIERIEVSQGPLSALYGANALGGVVNIITDLTGAPEATASHQRGSYDTNLLGFTVRRENWGMALGGGYTDGHRDHSETKNRYLIGQYNFRPEGEEPLNLYWQYLKKDGEAPGAEYSSWLSDQSEESWAANLNGRDLWLGGSWEYKIFAQYLDNHYDDDFSHDRHQTANYGFDLAGLYTLGNHEVLGGVMNKQERFDSTKSKKQDWNNSALYLQDDWKLGGSIRLVSGLRWDHNTKYDSPVSPRLAIIQSVSDQLTLKLGYGKAFRVPTVDELYWDEPSSGMHGNEDLKPEEGERYELTGEWRKGTQAVIANIFRSNLTNGIRWVDPEGDYTYTVTNIDKSKLNGAGLTWENTWNEWLTGRVGYQWLDDKGWEESTGRYSQDLNFFGRNLLNLGFGVKRGPFRAELGWKLVENRVQDGTELSDYQTGDFNMSYQITDGWKLLFMVNNITDEQYQVYDGYPMPGREIRVGVNYRF